MITDKKAALKEVRRSKPDYENISVEFWSDKTFVETAIKANIDAYKYAVKELRLDEGIVNTVLSRLNGYNSNLCFTDFPEELQNDKAFIRRVLLIDGKMFKHVPEKFKNDTEVVLTAVGAIGYNYYYVPNSLKDDKKIALIAVGTTPDAYKYLTERMKKDKDIAAIAAGALSKEDLDKYGFPKYLYRESEVIANVIKNKRIPDPLSILPNSVLSQPEYIIELLKTGLSVSDLGRSLPAKIAENKEFAQEAIKVCPKIYNYLDLSLRLDTDIAVLAVETDEEMIKYIPAGCLDDRKDLLLKAVEKDGMLISHDVFKNFKDDSEMALTAVLNDGHAYNYISKRLQQNETIMLATISDNIACFVFTKNPELCNDKEFMLKAIEMNEETLRYASKNLRNDRDFALSIQQHITGKTAPLNNPFGRFAADRDFVLEAVKANPESIKYAADSLKYDKDFIAQAIKVSPRVKLYCDPEMAKPSKEHFMEQIKTQEKNSILKEAMKGAKKKIEERKATVKLDERDDGR